MTYRTTVLDGVIRTPVSIDKACFSSGYKKHGNPCDSCELADQCKIFSSQHAEKVFIEDVKFKITPDRLLPKLDFRDPDGENLDDTYVLCYQLVFDQKPPDGIRQESKDEILAAASELGCSARVYLLCLMISFQDSNPDRQFYANMLKGHNAISKVRDYRDLCHKRFGCFDITSLNLLTKRGKTTLEDSIRNSELIFARFVVAYKLQSGGKPWKRFYDLHELSLDPRWLAIEDTYGDIIQEHLKELTDSKERRRHRHQVTRTLGELKRSKQSARTIFAVRESILPSVLQTVLREFRIQDNELMSTSRVVTSASHFWFRLGIAIQHLGCLKLLNHDKSTFLRARSLSYS